jgi:hypothetical protein
LKKEFIEGQYRIDDIGNSTPSGLTGGRRICTTGCTRGYCCSIPAGLKRAQLQGFCGIEDGALGVIQDEEYKMRRALLKKLLVVVAACNCRDPNPERV